MAHIIEDGKGTGNKARVDENNKLATTSIIRSEMAFISEKNGEAFRLTSTFIAVPASRVLAFWIQNISASSHFHVEKFRVGWNGGDTNHDRCLKAELRGGVPEPTANNTALTATGLNSTIPKTAELKGYAWDEVGGGMTVASDGVLSATAIFNKGYNIVSPDGAIVVGTNGSLGVFVEPEEAGLITVTVEGYYESNEKEV